MNLVLTLKWMAGLALVALILRSVAIFSYRVENDFMEPGVRADQIVLGYRWSYGVRFPWTDAKKLDALERKSPPKINDIVALEFKHQPGLVFVKRVIAVPGDRFEVKDGVLRINDQACIYDKVTDNLVRERCVNGERLIQSGQEDVVYAERLLVEGEYLVLYDNRLFEEDMALYAIVNYPQILGKVIWSY